MIHRANAKTARVAVNPRGAVRQQPEGRGESRSELPGPEFVHSAF